VISSFRGVYRGLKDVMDMPAEIETIPQKMLFFKVRGLEAAG